MSTFIALFSTFNPQLLIGPNFGDNPKAGHASFTLDIHGGANGTIVDVTNLTDLSIESNYLVEIPESIYQLPNLITINASSNQLTSIPESVNLPNLEELYFNGNQISSLPYSIENSNYLRRFWFNDMSFLSFLKVYVI